MKHSEFISNKLTTLEISKLINFNLYGSELYLSIKNKLKDDILKSKPIYEDPHEVISKMMKEMNMENDLKNYLFEYYKSRIKDNSPVMWADYKFKDINEIDFLPPFYKSNYFESLDCIIQAKSIWNDFIRQRCKILQKNLKKPAVKNKIETIDILNEEKEEEKKESDELSNVRTIIYDHTTFLNAIMKIRSTNFAGNPALSWSCIKVNIQTKTLEELQRKYSELSISLRQIGIDNDKAFYDERSIIGERLLAKNIIPSLQQFSKRGIPHHLRFQIYKKILCGDITEKEYLWFDKLQDNLMKWDLMLDEVIKCDIAEFCNDDKYFIFQDLLTTIISSFFRDPWIAENLAIRPHNPIIGYNSRDQPIGCIPPCGVVPNQFFSRYAGPFAFMTEKIPDAYFLFRGFYVKHLCYLHTISSNQQSIIGISKLFEDLLQTFEPDVIIHMQTLGISPLKITFPWFIFAFVNVLNPDQVILLWDRIIGFDSLEILAILAAAIFVVRAKLILQSNTIEEVEELFYDLFHIKVIPLIQNFLFGLDQE